MKITTEKIKEFIRFGVVGVLATGIHYAIYYLLLNYLTPTFSYTIGYLISLCINFILSNYFTFKTSPTYKKGIGFITAHGINYLLHIGFLNLFIYMGLSNELAPIPVFIIVVPINFILVRSVLKSSKLK